MVSPSQDRRYGLVTGTAYKAPVALATTANITLSGEQSIDGTTTSSSDVLVKDQTDTVENGIYTSSSGAWVRREDFDNTLDVVTGTAVRVLGGTVNALSEWYLSTSGTITFDSSNITFASLFRSGTYTATGVGFSPTTPTATYEWALNRGVVTIYMPTISQASGGGSGTSFQITGMPSYLYPGATRTFGPLIVTDNGSLLYTGYMAIGTNGVMTLYTTGGGGGWTGSGTKAVFAGNVTYKL